MAGFHVFSYSSPNSSRRSSASSDHQQQHHQHHQSQRTQRAQRVQRDSHSHEAVVADSVELCRVLKPSISGSIHEHHHSHSQWTKPSTLVRESVFHDDPNETTNSEDHSVDEKAITMESDNELHQHVEVAPIIIPKNVQNVDKLHRKSLEVVNTLDTPFTTTTIGTSVCAQHSRRSLNTISKPSFRDWQKLERRQGSKLKKYGKNKKRRRRNSNGGETSVESCYRRWKSQFEEWSEDNAHCIRFRHFQYLGRKYITTTKAFRWFILLCILVNCLFIAIEDPATEENVDSRKNQLSFVELLR